MKAWDKACGASFLGNFYPCPLKLQAPSRPGVTGHFKNAEAAFQALKFWGQAERFQSKTGNGAFRLKQELKGQEDWSYGGYGSNWDGMWLQLGWHVGSSRSEVLSW